jgi:hypothetical protein
MDVGSGHLTNEATATVYCGDKSCLFEPQTLDWQSYTYCALLTLHNTVTNGNLVDPHTRHWEYNFNRLLPDIKMCQVYLRWMHMPESLKISHSPGKIVQIIGSNLYTSYTPLTVGSSPYTSSPTTASNIALRISSVGFDTVSLLKSTTRIWKLIQCVPKSRFPHHMMYGNSVTKTTWLIFTEVPYFTDYKTHLNF